MIFDADHTLIEFDEDEKRAFRLAFADFGVNLTDEECRAYRDFSYECWEKLHLSEVHTEEIRKNYHAIYKNYVPYLIEELSKLKNLHSVHTRLEEKFSEYLSLPSFEIENSLSVVKRLSEKYSVSIATNGLGLMQRNRLERFMPYVDGLFISEEIGTIKPDPVFFERMIYSLGAKKEECLMIGDSLSSDIAGAKQSGIKCCWFNRFSAENKCGPSPDFEISSLEELFSVL